MKRRSAERKPSRWRLHDYASPGAYFVTTVTHDWRRLFGTVKRDGIALSVAGEIVGRYWRDVGAQFSGVIIDQFVVMPHHVHAIVFLEESSSRTVDLSQVVGWAKQRATREIRIRLPHVELPIWHRSFHERIIRDPHHLASVRRYIAFNPARAWKDECRG